MGHLSAEEERSLCQFASVAKNVHMAAHTRALNLMMLTNTNPLFPSCSLSCSLLITRTRSPSFLHNSSMLHRLSPRLLRSSSLLVHRIFSLHPQPTKLKFPYYPFSPRPFLPLKVSMASSSSHSHKHTNRLASEQSPYLLQHAHNPVTT